MRIKRNNSSRKNTLGYIKGYSVVEQSSRTGKKKKSISVIVWQWCFNQHRLFGLSLFHFLLRLNIVEVSTFSALLCLRLYLCVLSHERTESIRFIYVFLPFFCVCMWHFPIGLQIVMNIFAKIIRFFFLFLFLFSHLPTETSPDKFSFNVLCYLYLFIFFFFCCFVQRIWLNLVSFGDYSHIFFPALNIPKSDQNFPINSIRKKKKNVIPWNVYYISKNWNDGQPLCLVCNNRESKHFNGIPIVYVNIRTGRQTHHKHYYKINTQN